MNKPCYPCAHNLKSVPVFPKPMTPDEIIDKGCMFLGIEKKVLVSKRRDREFVEYRQILMVLIKKETGISLDKIGELFNRDHSTVIHAKRTVSNLCATDEIFYDRFKSLNRYIFN